MHLLQPPAGLRASPSPAARASRSPARRASRGAASTALLSPAPHLRDTPEPRSPNHPGCSEQAGGLSRHGDPSQVAGHSPGIPCFPQPSQGNHTAGRARCRQGPHSSGVLAWLPKAAVNLQVSGRALADVYLCHAATRTTCSPARGQWRCQQSGLIPGQVPGSQGFCSSCPIPRAPAASPQPHLLSSASSPSAQSTLQ